MKKLSKIILLAMLILVFAAALVLASVLTGDADTVGISGVIINEIMTKNVDSCPDEFDNYLDWIELHNTNTRDADISGCGLSDDVTGGVKYVFPRGSVIKAGGYLVVYCAGDASIGEYYTDFKLSTSDEVVLYNQGGGEIECITLRKAEDGKSLARESKSSMDWHDMQPTPGYPNTDEGIIAYADYMATRVIKDNEMGTGSVIINEFMASNATTIAANDGGYYDWAELYNTTEEAVNIKGYSISDDVENPYKYTVNEDILIPADGYLIVYCSGNIGYVNGELHVPFKLSAYEESIVLSDADGVMIDKVTYQRQNTDESLARDNEDNFQVTNKPTPGYPNTERGWKDFSEQNKIPTSVLYISEIMGSNSRIGIEDGGTTLYPDFIEIYNSGDEDIELEGYALSDKPTNPAKWVFPKVTIESGEYMLLLATSQNDTSNDSGYYRTNFSIGADGDTVYLFSPEGKFLDKLAADKFVEDMSIGRNEACDVLYYESPTPDEKNSGKGYFGQTTTPVFEILPGVYDDEITVEISCGEGETVYYTTDCTVPTTRSKKYKKGIKLDENTVIRAKTFKDGYFNDFSCATGTYLFTSDDALHDLPVVTLVTDPDNLWDGENGIYAYGDSVDFDDDTWPYWQSPANFWKDIEVPASFEVFDDNGKQAFQQNIGIRISGAFGQGREQKGFAVTARNEYGDNRMNYKFFDNLEYTEYKSVLLRCGAQDQANGKIRDVLSAGVLYDTDVNFLYQAYKPYVMYLNGKYWGVYFLREKRNRFFVAQHEGMGLDNSENLTLIKSETRANYGSTQEWVSLMNYVRKNGVSSDAHYKYLSDRLDIDSFIDYMICEIYVANSDYWNIQMYKTEGGKWRFIFYDFCWGWGNVEHDTLHARRLHEQPCSDLFNALLERDDFRDKFIRRFAELMDSVFNEEKVLSLIDELYAQVEPEMKRERSLFNSSDSPYFDYVDPMNYSSYETFVKHINEMKTFAKKRRSVVISQIQDEFDLSDKYIEEVFGDS